MLRKTTLNLDDLVAWGADGEEDDLDEGEGATAPKPKPGPRKITKPIVIDDDEDDEDDETEHIKDPKDRKILKLSRENRNRRRRERELETEKAALADELQAQKDGDATDAGKWQRKHSTLETKYKELEAKAKNGAIRTAVVSNSDYKWHDVDMVLDLLDRDQLAVDLDDGSVGGLEDQLKVIAKKKAFLLKSTSGAPGGNNGRTGSAPQSSATGTRGQEAASTETELLDTFPALRNLA